MLKHGLETGSKGFIVYSHRSHGSSLLVELSTTDRQSTILAVREDLSELRPHFDKLATIEGIASETEEPFPRVHPGDKRFLNLSSSLPRRYTQSAHPELVSHPTVPFAHRVDTRYMEDQGSEGHQHSP